MKLNELSPKPVALVLLAALATAGCGDDPATPDGPPVLPPVDSLQADLSLFEGAAAADAEAAASSAVGSHFLSAVVAVGIARIATVAVMALPVATFAAATSVEPVLEDDAYHWRYSVEQDGSSLVADLAGYGDGAESVWERRITTNATSPPLDEFLWYEGRALLTGQGGEWHIYDATQPSSSAEVLAIDWAHPAADTWTLSFTNVDAESEAVGDVLEYEVDGTLRIMRFLDASQQVESVVEWNVETGTGSIEAPGYNGGVKSCWDAAQDNTPCS